MATEEDLQVCYTEMLRTTEAKTATIEVAWTDGSILRAADFDTLVDCVRRSGKRVSSLTINVTEDKEPRGNWATLAADTENDEFSYALYCRDHDKGLALAAKLQERFQAMKPFDRPEPRWLAVSIIAASLAAAYLLMRVTVSRNVALLSLWFLPGVVVGMAFALSPLAKAYLPRIEIALGVQKAMRTVRLGWVRSIQHFIFTGIGVGLMGEFLWWAITAPPWKADTDREAAAAEQQLKRADDERQRLEKRVSDLEEGREACSKQLERTVEDCTDSSSRLAKRLRQCTAFEDDAPTHSSAKP